MLMGVTTSGLVLSAVVFAAAPASAQVQVSGQVTVQRNQDDPHWESGPADDEYEDDVEAGFETGYGPYRPAGFGIRIEAGGSANEYGPYGYPERGYGVYAEVGYRNRGSSLRAAFDFGRRDGFEAGIEAARYGRFDPWRHRYYRSTRGWSFRYGARDAYDVNYRNGFRAGYEEGYRRAARGQRRYGRW
jgi:hypothetical protein